MNDQSSMFDPPTSPGIASATSSPASAAGPTRSASPAGEIVQSGLGRVPANRSAAPANAEGSMTSGTCGLSGSSLSEPADLPLSSVNRSPQQWSSGKETKTCTQCGLVKPLDDFRKYSGRGRSGRRPLCKPCQRQYEKRWRSASIEYRQKQRSEHKARHPGYSREYRAKNRARYLVAECRRRCAKKGWPFDLDQHVEAIQARIDRGTCELTGYPLDLKPRVGRSFASPSIDRIKPKDGYLYANIRVICLAANSMLGEWGEGPALAMVRAWLTKIGG